MQPLPFIFWSNIQTMEQLDLLDGNQYSVVGMIRLGGSEFNIELVWQSDLGWLETNIQT